MGNISMKPENELRYKSLIGVANVMNGDNTGYTFLLTDRFEACAVEVGPDHRRLTEIAKGTINCAVFHIHSMSAKEPSLNVNIMTYRYGAKQL
jgi:hypothetical protein